MNPQSTAVRGSQQSPIREPDAVFLERARSPVPRGHVSPQDVASRLFVQHIHLDSGPCFQVDIAGGLFQKNAVNSS